MEELILELRNRLEYLALAGIHLAEEDFRLKHAMENIKPLGERAGVFKQVYAMCETLIREKNPDVLLDVCGLLDGILVTMAKEVQALETAELHPLSGFATVGEAADDRQVRRIAQCLTSSGGGRYVYLEEVMKESPAVFRDHRLLGLLVDDFSDTYSDIACLIQKWFEGQSSLEALPVLKEGFDPGARGSYERLMSIITLAKDRENDFYKTLFESAKKKEIRELALKALGHEKSNASYLEDAVKTLRGSLLETAKKILEEVKG